MSLDGLLKESTVKVCMEGSNSWGTGFFVSKDLVLTCFHVVRNWLDKEIDLWWKEGKLCTARVVPIDIPPELDVAVLRVECQPLEEWPPCAALGDAFRPGDPFYIYGYSDDFPEGDPVSLEYEGQAQEAGLVVIKAKNGQVRPGHSGSPILNIRTGEVCGLISDTRNRISDLGGIGVPIASLWQWYPELEQLNEECQRVDSRWSKSKHQERQDEEGNRRLDGAMPSRSILGELEEKGIINQSSKKDFSRHDIRNILLTNFAVTCTLALLRLLGLFEDVELAHYDLLLRSRATVEPDNRIVLVSASDRDYSQQDRQGESEKLGSFSDQNLLDLITKISDQDPKVIGISIYRPYDGNADPLSELIKNEENRVLVCEIKSTEEEGVHRPPWLEEGENNFGFSNFTYDYDGIVRRSLLGINNNQDSTCPSDFSFELLVAAKYLNLEPLDILSPKLIGNKTEEYNSSGLKEFISPFYGAYQGLDSAGFQVMLNYRAVRGGIENITELKYDFSEVLNENFDKSVFKDRIVLIGISAETVATDEVRTPYNQTTKGIFLKAHIISDLLTRLDKKGDSNENLTVLPQQAILLLSFSLYGVITIAAIRFKGYYFLISITFLGGGIILLFSFVSIIMLNMWMPVFLPLVVLLSCALSGIFYSFKTLKDKQ